jgi:DNA polymerase type B, organellar and viral
MSRVPDTVKHLPLDAPLQPSKNDMLRYFIPYVAILNESTPIFQQDREEQLGIIAVMSDNDMLAPAVPSLRVALIDQVKRHEELIHLYEETKEILKRLDAEGPGKADTIDQQAKIKAQVDAYNDKMRRTVEKLIDAEDVYRKNVKARKPGTRTKAREAQELIDKYTMILEDLQIDRDALLKLPVMPSEEDIQIKRREWQNDRKVVIERLVSIENDLKDLKGSYLNKVELAFKTLGACLGVGPSNINDFVAIALKRPPPKDSDELMRRYSEMFEPSGIIDADMIQEQRTRIKSFMSQSRARAAEMKINVGDGEKVVKQKNHMAQDSLNKAIAVVDEFRRLELFEVLTEVDFKRRVTKARAALLGVEGAHAINSIPDIGRFGFRIVPRDHLPRRSLGAASDYHDFMVFHKPLDDARADELCRGLEELLRLLKRYSNHIKYITGVPITEVIDTSITTTHRTLMAEIYYIECEAAIAQLKENEPIISNGIRFLDDAVNDYDREEGLKDVRIRFVNPFILEPVYLLFSVAHAIHSAVDKTHYWIRIKNSECDSMSQECIPKALAVRVQNIAIVPEDQIKEVASIISSHPRGWELEVENYNEVLNPLKVPWIVVNNVCADGTWKICSASSQDLMGLAPLEWEKKISSIVALHLRAGHMTRIISIVYYDEIGWMYRMLPPDATAFAITAKIDEHSGLGSSTSKLLRGHPRMNDKVPSIGIKTFEYLQAITNKIVMTHQVGGSTKRKEKVSACSARGCLEILSSREIIPSLISDALDRLAPADGSEEVILSPGTWKGVEYPEGIPWDAITEKECIDEAYREWDARAAVTERDANKEYYGITQLLKLPQNWLLVKNLRIVDGVPTWDVEGASDHEFDNLKPHGVVDLIDNLIIIVAGSRPSRIIDFMLTMPHFSPITPVRVEIDDDNEEVADVSVDDSQQMAPDGSVDEYSMRSVYPVVLNSKGIVATIAGMRPTNPITGAPLISDDELEAVKAAIDAGKPVSEWINMFERIKTVVIDDVRVTRGGNVKIGKYKKDDSDPEAVLESRVRDIDFVARSRVPTIKEDAPDMSDHEKVIKVSLGGQATIQEVIEEASDVLRLWQDPDLKLWVMGKRTYYCIDDIRQSLLVKLPIHLCVVDYETLNRITDEKHETIVSMLSYMIIDGTTPISECQPQLLDGICSTQILVKTLMAHTTEKRVRLLVITFHGAFFDSHMLLEGFATWGDLGLHKSDGITDIGNKLLEIRCDRIKVIDMRRFTGGSLASTAAEMRVKTMKSSANHTRVQKVYEDASYDLALFKIRMRELKATDVLNGLDRETDYKEFSDRVRTLDGYAAFSEYCRNDVKATVECWQKLKEGCDKFIDCTTLPVSLKSELKIVYSPDRYVTMPSMAYSIGKRSLPWVPSEMSFSLETWVGLTKEKRLEYEDKVTTDLNTLDWSYEAVAARYDKGDQVLMPQTRAYGENVLLRGALIGGESDVYDFVAPGIIVERHQVLDYTSLYPFAGFHHMPMGDSIKVIEPSYVKIAQERLHILQEGKTETDAGKMDEIAMLEWLLDLPVVTSLPVPNRLGVYYCTITSQPVGHNVIPMVTKDKPISWQSKEKFSRMVPVQLIYQHRQHGGTIDVHFGVYWPVMFDHFYDLSLWVWKAVKMEQDRIISECKAKEKAIGKPTEEQKESIWAPYKAEARSISKFLLVSFHGKTNRRLKSSESGLVYGKEALIKYQEEHQKDQYTITYLARQEEKRSILQQITQPYCRASLVSELLNPKQAYAMHTRDGPAELALACCMYGWSHFHKNEAMRWMYLSKCLRGIETDGLHINQEMWEHWCEERVAEGRKEFNNPYWIESSVCTAQPGDPYSDGIFKSSVGDIRSKMIVDIMGGIKCPTAAARYATAHKMTGTIFPRVADFGHLKEEIPYDGLFKVSYPARKMYIFEPHPTGVKAIDDAAMATDDNHKIRTKGIGRETREGKAAIKYQLKLFYEGDTEKIKDQRELSHIIEESPHVTTIELFQRLGRGEGVDVIDYRFQGRLSKIDSDVVHYANEEGSLLPEGHVHYKTPIHHSFATKRIAPHRSFHLQVSAEGVLSMPNGAVLIEKDAEQVKCSIFKIMDTSTTASTVEDYVERMYATRGVTLSSSVGPIYVSNSVMKLIYSGPKKIKPKVIDEHHQEEQKACDADATSRGSIAEGEGGLREGCDKVREPDGKKSILSSSETKKRETRRSTKRESRKNASKALGRKKKDDT